MLRGEFHKSLPLLLTGQQLSVLRSMCTIPHLCISLFETGIRVTRYSKFVNGILFFPVLNIFGISQVSYP